MTVMATTAFWQLWRISELWRLENYGRYQNYGVLENYGSYGVLVVMADVGIMASDLLSRSIPGLPS